jgi:acetylornithine deacetylase/succinyl-diaminopimelate desuccinylase-like protein
MRVREVLRDMVLLASSEHDDPRPILDYVEEAGKALGATVTPVDNGARPATLLAWGTPRLLFSGHLDTVPLSGEWKTKAGTLSGGRMYGRGTTDMKAGCAAMLAAASKLRERGDFGILYTTDEETQMDGAQRAVDAGLLAQTELVVVGEPTSLRPCLGQKGVLQIALTTEGKSAHASMPWAGENAIGRMGRLLAALRPFAGTTPRRSATMTASPNVVRGGVAMNVVADSCTLELDVRYAPKLTEHQARTRLEAALKRANVPYAISVVHRLGALKSSPGGAAKRLRAKARRPFGHCDFATEAAVFAPTGAAFLVLGPGEPHHCHVTDESVDLAQVDEAVAIYESALTTRS